MCIHNAKYNSHCHDLGKESFHVSFDPRTLDKDNPLFLLLEEQEWRQSIPHIYF